MCAPMATLLPLLAIGATAGGTFLQMQGQQQAMDARDAATRENIKKQTDLRHQADALFQSSLHRADPDAIKADADQAAQQRAATLVPQAVADPVGASLIPGMADNASSATKNAVVNQSQAAHADLTRQGMGKAILSGTNDAFTGLARDIQPNADRIGQRGVDIQAQNNLLPLELAAADRQGGGLRNFGALLSGAGKVASMGANFSNLGGLFSGGGAVANSGGAMVTPNAANGGFIPGGI